MTEEKIYAGKMPILALRGLAVFPDQTVHFDVGRSKSVRALESAMKQDQTLLLIPQKDMMIDDPKLIDLYSIGTVARVKQVLKTQGENLRVLVTGICRGKITELSQSDPYLSGIVESVPVPESGDSVRAHAMRREANSLYGLYLQMSEQPGQAVYLRMMSSESSGFIADSIAQNSGIDFPDKAKLLCQLNPNRRLEMGHARALLAIDDPKLQIRAYNEIVSQGLSVHKVEEMVKELSEGGSVKTTEGGRLKARGTKISEEYNILKDSLSRFFQTKVQLTCSDKGKGKIVIPFANERDMERIIEILDRLK